MKYYVLQCKVDSTDLKEENYGMMIVNEDNSREYVCNISDNIEDMKFLMDKMNDYNIEPYQAKEIIEDFKFNNK